MILQPLLQDNNTKSLMNQQMPIICTSYQADNHVSASTSNQ